MQFASRVQVISNDGKKASPIPAEMAARQVVAGFAVVLGNGKKVRCIQMLEASPTPSGPCRPVSVGSYMGTSYTRREAICNKAGDIIGYQHELNHLNAADRDLFQLAVTDNIVTSQC